MKIMYVVCRNCGHAEKEEIYEPDEARRKNIRLVAPSCKKCGSRDIELRDR